MMKQALEALRRVVDSYYGSHHPFHSPIWDDAELGLREIKSELYSLTKQREEFASAIVAMVEDGWLDYGYEGMSEAQEKCYEAYIKIKAAQGEG
jgi:hypothetical protein